MTSLDSGIGVVFCSETNSRLSSGFIDEVTSDTMTGDNFEFL